MKQISKIFETYKFLSLYTHARPLVQHFTRSRSFSFTKEPLSCTRIHSQPYIHVVMIKQNFDYTKKTIKITLLYIRTFLFRPIRDYTRLTVGSRVV